MAERKILVGDIQGGIPIHTGFDYGDTLVDPGGATLSAGGGTALTPDFYRTAQLIGSQSGAVVANSLVLAILITEPLILPANGMGSKVSCYTAPSAETIFTIKKAAGGAGGTSTTIGTFRFTAGSKNATFDIYSQVSFAAGDMFEVYTPSAPNGIANMILSFGVYMLNAANPNIPAPGNIVALGRYTYTGGETLVQIPGNCISIAFKAWGAGGGSVYQIGGAGGFVQGTVSVSPGTWLSIKVGGAGGTAGGGGGGGGMSSVFDIATNTPLFIAAGGGGGEDSYHGGAGGGLTGQTGSAAGGSYIGGTGGSQTAGGTVNGSPYQGGCISTTIVTNAGYNGGGGAVNSLNLGSGGGGGYYGGGAGSGRAAGGGGSSMVPSGGLTLGGDRTVPGNSTDPDRGTAGNPGQPGLIIITYMQ